jgi:hypothetical protein
MRQERHNPNRLSGQRGWAGSCQKEPFPCRVRTKRSRRHRGRLQRLFMGDIENKTNNCTVSDFLPLIPVG